jgi:alpha-D-ribose 1-methylphosphonate 5-triphosphate synthase subunit PhnL
MYAHLDDEVFALISSPLAARIRFIQADRFIEHPATSAVLETLEDICLRPRSLRPECIALIADAGAGKSTLLNPFRPRAA